MTWACVPQGGTGDGAEGDLGGRAAALSPTASSSRRSSSFSHAITSTDARTSLPSDRSQRGGRGIASLALQRLAVGKAGGARSPSAAPAGGHRASRRARAPRADRRQRHV